MKIYHYIKSHKRISSVLLLTADVFFFILTNPRQLPLAAMAIAFILLLSTIFMFCTLALALLQSMGYLKRNRQWVKEALTAFIFLLIVMQSVGQLSLKDVMALLPIIIVGYFYYTYTSDARMADCYH